MWLFWSTCLEEVHEEKKQFTCQRYDANNPSSSRKLANRSLQSRNSYFVRRFVIHTLLKFVIHLWFQRTIDISSAIAKQMSYRENRFKHHNIELPCSIYTPERRRMRLHKNSQRLYRVYIHITHSRKVPRLYFYIIHIWFSPVWSEHTITRSFFSVFHSYFTHVIFDGFANVRANVEHTEAKANHNCCALHLQPQMTNRFVTSPNTITGQFALPLLTLVN